jgi:lipopolysaccharide transport system ATP-binding protein
MTDPVIRVENLGKRYRIGERQSYLALRDVLARAVSAPVRLFQGRKPALPNGDPTHIWALKDVSFDVHQGEVVGIIGRNGSGKTTLLKILAQVTRPTEGHAQVRGRVGSLLEVGTGFHGELTGRENVFLSGAILGMTNAEILRKFDEIVAFAEVEKFLDTPLKHYSSGMQMRLAFSVAAHLEPEILLVDEVLAVGDAAFQKKCLGKMEHVATEGRTVVFISHNMQAVQQLCGRCLLMSNGEVVQQGRVGDCIQSYLRTGRDQSREVGWASLSLSSGIRRRGTGAARFESAELMSLHGEHVSQVYFGQPVVVRLSVWASRRLPNVIVGFSFVAADGAELQGTAAHDGGVTAGLRPGLQAFECCIDPMLLTPGRYFFRAAIFSSLEEYEHVYEFLPFDVVPCGEGAPDRVPSGHYVGYVYHPYKWREVPLEAKVIGAESTIGE